MKSTIAAKTRTRYKWCRQAENGYATNPFTVLVFYSQLKVYRLWWQQSIRRLAKRIYHLRHVRKIWKYLWGPKIIKNDVQFESTCSCTLCVTSFVYTSQYFYFFIIQISVWLESYYKLYQARIQASSVGWEGTEVAKVFCQFEFAPKIIEYILKL